MSFNAGALLVVETLLSTVAVAKRKLRRRLSWHRQKGDATMTKTAFGIALVGGLLAVLPGAAAQDAADDANQLPPELQAAVQGRYHDAARPGSLQGQLNRNARRILVDCGRDAPGALQRAIDAADPGDTVLVQGTCTENLFFPEGKDRLTLDGGGTATIVAATAAEDTVLVRGRGITITGFTIRGGRDVVTVSWGGNAFLDGNTVENGARFGIHLAQMGAAVIINNVVQNNVGGGIVVPGGSFAFIGFKSSFDTVASPNIIQNNLASGISLVRNATARISGNTIRDNSTNGVNVGRASHADLSDNRIDGNGTNGIQVMQGSGVNLGEDTGDTLLTRPNTTTKPNGQFGVRCVLGGYTDGRIGSLNGTRGAQSHAESCINSLILIP
jgi:parallel beta-helix repeat protein